MKLLIPLFFAVLFCNTVTAQPAQKCKATVYAEVSTYLYKISTDQAMISMRNRSGEFNLDVPLETFDSELDTLDAFMDASRMTLTYQGNTGVDFFELLNREENTGKFFTMQGTLKLNNVTKDVVSRYAVFKQNNSRDNNSQEIRFSLVMDIVPADFGLNKYVPALTKPVRLEITEQVLNRSD